jgi:hypothetical protein
MLGRLQKGACYGKEISHSGKSHSLPKFLHIRNEARLQQTSIFCERNSFAARCRAYITVRALLRMELAKMKFAAICLLRCVIVSENFSNHGDRLAKSRISRRLRNEADRAPFRGGLFIQAICSSFLGIRAVRFFSDYSERC